MTLGAWRVRLPAVVTAILAAAVALAGPAEQLEKERRRGAEVLRDVAALLQRRYHDPAFGGLDLRTRLARAGDEMRRAGSESATFGVVAALLAGLDDSHTFLVPPARAGALDYGWTPRMVGERCFVVDVRPGTDAARHQLRPGDEVLALDGAPPSRQNVWRTLHLVRFTQPEPIVRLSVRAPDGRRRELEVATQVASGGRRAVSFHQYLGSLRHRLKGRASSRYAEVGDVLVWKLATFDDAGRAMAQGIARARRRRALVLDLRGNGGGDVQALRRFTGAFFGGATVPIGSLRGRQGPRPLTAERWSREAAFAGELVVLVDSESASAAEVFARTVQLRRRGRVIGDRSGGAVMLSRIHVLLQTRDSRFVPYAVSVAEATVLMPDGSSLERVGLAPDEMALPTAEDLRDGRDAVLARAVALAGGHLTPDAAGALFGGRGDVASR
jgi:carboxyl-terminal processing protease